MQVENIGKLQSLRVKIDLIDNQIKNLLTERSKVVGQIAKYKKTRNLNTFDKEREKAILENTENSLQKAVFKQILRESKKEQTRERNESQS